MRLQFQRTFCLSPDFADCSIYQQQDQPALPVVETQPTVTPRIQQRRGLAVAVVVVLIMFASLLSWPILTQIIDPEPSSLLPISLDPVFALIQDAPQMPAKSEIPPYEIQNDLHHDSGSFNQEPAAVSPAADPSVPAGATPQMNVRNGGFRAVTYPSD